MPEVDELLVDAIEQRLKRRRQDSRRQRIIVVCSVVLAFAAVMSLGLRIVVSNVQELSGDLGALSSDVQQFRHLPELSIPTAAELEQNSKGEIAADGVTAQIVDLVDQKWGAILTVVSDDVQREEPSEYTITADAVDDIGTDPVLWLYRVDGGVSELVTSDDDSGSLGNNAEISSVDLEPGGIYYVRVTDYYTEAVGGTEVLGRKVRLSIQSRAAGGPAGVG